MTMRERVKSLCKNAGIPVNKLEADCGFSNGYINKMDRITPSSANVQKIADYFHVSPGFLLFGEEQEVDEITAYIHDPQMRRLILYAGARMPSGPDKAKFVEAVMRTIDLVVEYKKQ